MIGLEQCVAPTFSLAGRRAIASVRSRGVGAAVPRLLAECGADVRVGYRPRSAEVEAMVAELRVKGRARLPTPAIWANRPARMGSCTRA